MVNIHIVYEINKNFSRTSYPTLENCLIEAVSLTKNINDIDMYKYSGYGIGFGRKEKFSVRNGFGRNCILFAVDMSSSLNVDNKKNDTILGEGPTKGLDNTILTAEKSIQSTLLKIIRSFV